MSTAILPLRCPIAPYDLLGLYRRVRDLLEATNAAVTLCDGGEIDANAVTIDALAHIRLAAHRHACELRLRRVPPELLDLIHLMGMENIL